MFCAILSSVLQEVKRKIVTFLKFIVYPLTMIALLILEIFLMVLHIDRFVKIVVSVDRSKYNCCYSNYPLVSR